MNIQNNGNACALPVECERIQPLQTTTWHYFENFMKWKTSIFYDAKVQFLPIHPREMLHMHTRSQVFTVTLFIKAKLRQFKGPPTGEYIKYGIQI